MHLRRILLVLSVAALMVAAFATTAFAQQGKSADAPNCEQGQGRASTHQSVNRSDNDQFSKHFDKFFELCGGEFA